MWIWITVFQEQVPQSEGSDMLRRPLRVFKALGLISILDCLLGQVGMSRAVAQTIEQEPSQDFSWMNGNNRQKSVPSLFKNENLAINLYLDTYYNYSSNHPQDHTINGSATTGRSDEFQLNLASIEFEANYKNAIGRLGLQTGTMLSVVQGLDPTVNRGRHLNVSDLKYIREAAVGYHWDTWSGISFEMGIFPAYIGLESYLTQENWSYQRSLLSEFTPFYFQGIRLQIYPIQSLKIESWLVNGFQTYGKFNDSSGLGLSVSYRPVESLGFAANFYYGSDIQQNPDARRFHHDSSLQVRYWSAPEAGGVSQAAFSWNNHYGFESGGGLDASSTYFLGSSLANRLWFAKNLFALTLRVAGLTNPGRYLVSPFNGTGYQPPGTDFKEWDFTVTLDYMPNETLTFRAEVTDRHSSVPFFAGPGGTTNGSGGWGSPDPAYLPDLRTNELRGILAASFRM